MSNDYYDEEGNNNILINIDVWAWKLMDINKDDLKAWIYRWYAGQWLIYGLEEVKGYQTLVFMTFNGLLIKIELRYTYMLKD